MQAQLQIDKIENVMEWLEMVAENYTSKQSIDYLIDTMGELCRYLAFTGNQMAVSKKILNKAKTNAYNTLIISSEANKTYLTPMLAKDYISGKLEKEQYDYDVCERANRTILHTIEALRTAISALKAEVQVAGYAGHQ